MAFADLVLPDTTYLERHDVMSMLDRPISEFDGPIDAVRVPVVPPTGQCKPFQDVLIELASRLKFPAFTRADGTRKFRDYPDFIVNYETEPGSGIGFLAGWRGAAGDKYMRGEPNPKQWEMYAANNCVHHHRAAVLPVHAQLEPRLHGMGAAAAYPPLLGSRHRPDLFGGAAEVPPRRAGQGRGTQAAGTSARTDGDLFRSAAVLVRPARSAGDGQRAVPAQRGDAAPDGDVSLVGLAERVAAPDPYAQPSVRQS